MKQSIRKQFGQRVRELRRASGVSQEAFADKCGFARSYMSRLERGMANPSLDAIQTLADALDVHVAELFKEAVFDEMTMLVPFASDGTCFHPGLYRPQAKSFKVGPKEHPTNIATFEEALEFLRALDVARWWRPNGKGAWGVVTAVRWGKLPESQPLHSPDVTG